ALKQTLRHALVIADRLAILPILPGRSLCFRPCQFQLPWNHRPREVAFTDEIRHDVNVANRRLAKEEERVAQARLFFPETAGDIGEDLATADRGRVHERGNAG